MNRQLRNDVAATIFGLFFSNTGADLWLFVKYFSSRPNVPHPDMGLVYPLNNHGSYAYISITESTGLSLLHVVSFTTFFMFFLVVPKDPILPPPGTPRWLTYLGGSAKTDLANPTPRLKTIGLCSIIFWAAVIYFAGHSIVDFVVSEGIILKF
jgi:hypothetical protein